jgi:hypothetical protein
MPTFRLIDSADPPVATSRALPVSPIPMVAYNGIIEEGWGDSVAQSLNNLSERKGWLTFTPGDAGTSTTIPAPTSASMTPWITIPAGNGIFVPDWATVALVHNEIAAVHEGSGGPNTYDLQLAIGGATGVDGLSRIVRQTSPVGANLWFPVVWSCLIDVSALSSYQSVEILARRVAGSGVWTADGLTAVAIEPSYMGAIGWYGD